LKTGSDWMVLKVDVGDVGPDVAAVVSSCRL